MKKIAVVGTVGIPACYGGFESLVENLTQYRSDKIEYQVFCSSKSYKEQSASHNGAKLFYLPLNANGVQSIPYDILSLIKCWKTKPDTILILGVSGCCFLPIFKLFSKAKVITNIDGLEWKREKWGKWARKFLKLSESIAVKHSDVVITDNKAIGDYVTSEYTKSNVTIAYGGDHALRPSMNSQVPVCDDFSFGLCRIEPENNVHLILEAFSRVDKKLKFVGNWQASEFGKELKSKYAHSENINLIEPIYNLDELYKLRKSCSLYLHGHSAGGTNPSLVEMMHFGVPIFAFDCTFNRYSTDNKADYFLDSSTLVDMLQNLNQDRLDENGRQMEAIANKRYTWQEITRLYEQVY